jgi:Phage integrase, N-terminal SAM-like domain
MRVLRPALAQVSLNPSSKENEVEGFAAYLCEARGLSKVTIREHRKRLRTFLGFLRFDRNPSRLQQLS